jgi:hypothetical protein
LERFSVGEPVYANVQQGALAELHKALNTVEMLGVDVWCIRKSRAESDVSVTEQLRERFGGTENAQLVQDVVRSRASGVHGTCAGATSEALEQRFEVIVGEQVVGRHMVKLRGRILPRVSSELVGEKSNALISAFKTLIRQAVVKGGKGTGVSIGSRRGLGWSPFRRRSRLAKIGSIPCGASGSCMVACKGSAPDLAGASGGWCELPQTTDLVQASVTAGHPRRAMAALAELRAESRLLEVSSEEDAAAYIPPERQSAPKVQLEGERSDLLQARLMCPHCIRNLHVLPLTSVLLSTIRCSLDLSAVHPWPTAVSMPSAPMPPSPTSPGCLPAPPVRALTSLPSASAALLKPPKITLFAPLLDPTAYPSSSFHPMVSSAPASFHILGPRALPIGVLQHMHRCQPAMAIIHDRGRTLDLRWLPAGNGNWLAAENDVSTLDRAGLLAVAHGDGFCTVYAVPTPQSLGSDGTSARPVRCVRYPCLCFSVLLFSFRYSTMSDSLCGSYLDTD